MICQDCGRDQSLRCSYRLKYVSGPGLAYPCKGFIPELVALSSLVESMDIHPTLLHIRGLDHDYAQLEWTDGETEIEARYIDDIWNVRMIGFDFEDSLYITGTAASALASIRQEIAMLVAR